MMSASAKWFAGLTETASKTADRYACLTSNEAINPINAGRMAISETMTDRILSNRGLRDRILGGRPDQSVGTMDMLRSTLYNRKGDLEAARVAAGSVGGIAGINSLIGPGY